MIEATTPELATCPCCRGPAEVQYMASSFREPMAADINMALVGCKDLGCVRQSSYRNQAAAIAAWNRRTPPPEVEGLVEAARALVERWDSPLWANVQHTGEYIATLRAALTAWENRK